MAARGEDEEDKRGNACLELNVLTRNEVGHVGEDAVLPSPHHADDGGQGRAERVGGGMLARLDADVLNLEEGEEVIGVRSSLSQLPMDEPV